MLREKLEPVVGNIKAVAGNGRAAADEDAVFFDCGKYCDLWTAGQEQKTIGTDGFEKRISSHQH